MLNYFSLPKNELQLLIISSFLLATFCCSSPIKSNNVTLENQTTALIEIPAGTTQKWELNKNNGLIERDAIDGQPRTINYLGYPGNYGMIPNTILDKKNGGDGDPLDILVLGDPVKRGDLVNCKIIGVLKLIDNNENDDKLIGISTSSSLFEINSITEMDQSYPGISNIIETWFTNYKGKNTTKSLGFADKQAAIELLNAATKQHNNLNN